MKTLILLVLTVFASPSLADQPTFLTTDDLLSQEREIDSGILKPMAIPALCSTYDYIVLFIKERFDATLDLQGVATDEISVEIWKDPSGGFTVILRHANGGACLISHVEGSNVTI